jgi:single-strand DNA-binding protein
MANFNKVLLMGNLTADPEMRYTPKGTAVADIRLAINRYVSGSEANDRQEETTFVDVTLWNRQAEVANSYLRKGSAAFIEGRLQLDSWEDKQTGQKRTKLRVIGENLQLLPRGGAGNDFRGGDAPASNPYPQRSYNGPSNNGPAFDAPYSPQRGGQQGGGYPSQRPAPSSPANEPWSNIPADDDDVPF